MKIHIPTLVVKLRNGFIFFFPRKLVVKSARRGRKLARGLTRRGPGGGWRVRRALLDWEAVSRCWAREARCYLRPDDERLGERASAKAEWGGRADSNTGRRAEENKS